MLLERMEALQHDASVQESICAALQMLSLDSECRMILSFPSSISLLASSMYLHTTAPGVQEMLCGVIRNICCNNETTQEHFCSSQGLRLCVSALKLHLKHPRVIEQALSAIYHLVAKASRQAEFVQRGGLVAIITALKRYPRVVGVVEHSCNLLRLLARDSGIMRKMKSMDCVPLVRDAQQHFANHEIQSATKPLLRMLTGRSVVLPPLHAKVPLLQRLTSVTPQPTMSGLKYAASVSNMASPLLGSKFSVVSLLSPQNSWRLH
eukprot:TRINITY_DN745_c0_g5_i1.p1 TRINITY_DN745_c0_g5~~TRINITY_DN745_c0_g5_i1.p1  ORF type:complete len:264 (-),score=56.63 TRINITY_DN745_c0_g5_i1:273-1064(-)